MHDAMDRPHPMDTTMITALKLSSRIARGALLIALTAAAACSGDATEPGTGNPGTGKPPVPDLSIASIVVTPDTATMIGAGGFRRMQARLLTASGAEVTGRTVTWATEDPSIAYMSGEMLTALNPGTVWITATADGKQGRAQIRVVAPTVTVLQVAHANLTLRSGDLGYAGVTPRAADGREMRDVVITYASSDTSVVAIEGHALRGRRGGTATVTIRSGEATTQVHVLVPDVLQYRLQSLGGAALPAETPHVRTIAADSSFVEEWARVTEGTLFLSTINNEYVQRATITKYRREGSVRGGNVIVGPVEQVGVWQYGDRGVREETPVSGDQFFTSSIQAGLRYHGIAGAARALAVYQEPLGLAGQTWSYALQ